MSDAGAPDGPRLFSASRRRDWWWLKILVGSLVATLLYAAYWVTFIALDLPERVNGTLVAWAFATAFSVAGVFIAFVWLRGRPFPDVFNRPRYVCSRCLSVFTARQGRLVPAFEVSTDDYLLAFRCDGCWPVTLRETEARFLANVEWARERLKFVGCLERAGLRGLNASEESRLREQFTSLLNALRANTIFRIP